MTAIVESVTQRAKWLRATAGIIAFFVSLGASGAVFFSKFERRSDADQIHHTQDDRLDALERETEVHDRLMRAQEDEARFWRAQLWEIARSTGAARVPAPPAR